MSDGPEDFKKGRRRKENAVDLSKLDRLPPHSLEAEQALLGCLLLNYRDSMADVQQRLGYGLPTDIYYDLRHQMLAEVLFDQDAKNEPIDLVTISQILRDSKQLESVGGVAYLSSLMDAVPSVANVSYYASIAKEKHTLRKNLSDITKIIGDVYEFEGEIDKHFEDVEKVLMRVMNRHGSGAEVEMPIKDIVHQVVNEMQADLENQGRPTGIPTGLANLDKKLLGGGLQPKTMGVIAARPSVGKTSLAMNIAESVALESKLPVGVLSLEMGKESLVYRMICSRARVNSKLLKEGIFTEKDLANITAAAGQIAASKIHIDDTSGYNTIALKTKVRRMVQKHGIKVLIIDYLQLLHGAKKSSGENRQQEVAEISGAIKEIAKELSLAVIVLAQLNREMDKDKRKPKISDLRESGAIEQDADWILLLSKKLTDEEEEELGPVAADTIEVHGNLAKQRNGPIGPMSFVFIKAFTRYEVPAGIRDEDIPK